MTTHGTPAGWPMPVGPYSIFAAGESVVATAGQLGTDPASGRLVDGGLAAEVRQAISNIEQALKAGGSSLQSALKITVYLADLARDYAEFDRVYREVVPEPRPARTTIGAVLPNGLIEVDALGVLTSTTFVNDHKAPGL